MSQPKWKVIVRTDDSLLCEDETGLYDPELDIFEGVPESGESGRRYTIILERFHMEDEPSEDGDKTISKFVDEHGHVPWFARDLKKVANSCGLFLQDLRSLLLSPHSRDRMAGYLHLVSYFGSHEFDHDPVSMSYDEWETYCDEAEGKVPRGTPKFEIKKGYRTHTISQCRVRCPYKGGELWAKPGTFIRFGMGEIGRVLGRVDAPSDGCLSKVEGELAVLVLSDSLSFLSYRFVDPKDVISRLHPSIDLLRWFLQPELPSPDVVLQLEKYGTLSDHYISDPRCGPDDLRESGVDKRAEVFGWKKKEE